jgi:hypothetical protein
MVVSPNALEGKEVNLYIFSYFAVYGKKSSYEIYEGFYLEEIVKGKGKVVPVLN